MAPIKSIKEITVKLPETLKSNCPKLPRYTEPMSPSEPTDPFNVMLTTAKIVQLYGVCSNKVVTAREYLKSEKDKQGL